MKVALLCILGALSMLAQTVAPMNQNTFQYTVQTIAGAIPTASTCLVGPAKTCKLQIATVVSSDPTFGSPFLCAVDLVGTGQTITIQDGQATPVVWIVGGGALGSSGNPTGYEWHVAKDDQCRPFLGGLYIIAGSSGATGRLLIKYNTSMQ